MALMPPRRSARLSEDNFGNHHDQPLSSSPNVFQDRMRGGKQWPPTSTAVKTMGNGGKQKNTSSTDGSAAGSSSTAATGIDSSKSTIADQKPRKERRWEEIADESENEEEDGDFMNGFTRPIITGNAKHAASIPVPRQPRTTFHEQAGDDGFIFSNANPTADAKGKGKASAVEGAKGAPPRRNMSSNTGNVGDTLRTASTGSDRRVSSGPVKAMRRVSLFRDGTVAVPHPNIADTDLYRHCSSDLDPRQRLQNLAIWTLERSYAKIKKTYSAPSTSRHTLDDTVRGTIENLVQNNLLLDWPGRRRSETLAKQGKSSKDSLRPHPRNEVNAKAEVQLQKQIDLMESEMKAWKEAEGEMERLEGDIRSLQETLSSSNSEKDDCSELSDFLSMQVSSSCDQKEDNGLSSIRKSLSNAATWLRTSESSDPSTLTAAQAGLARLSEDLFVRDTGENVPSRPAKRRRTTSHRGEDESVRSEPTPLHLQGTDADPRWEDVEFNADLLNSHAHSYAQLARLSDRYTTAISARGAQAIGELIGSEDRSSTIPVRAREGEAEGATSSTSSSMISREGQNTLQRILSGIRKLERGTTFTEEDPEAERNNHSEGKGGPSAGDVSDGDILRAFAGISRARR
ncbi:uncharacterized protein FA14DRAFT_160011 [Meira miltonrushii]|uniref:Uncharacterized protein n=1 Tax=Meira miltonrushii TaxID=1280837 RepID=A0A316VSG4_9BASI|nr:uncharacterized protein FA14DRAFT_160011 [Meira miltonrushii]PWN38445.1 hypothetical protein FA14DRAFT_160011 [Meira miltonrushii]